MGKSINISVAIATYNGEKYIKEQIDSILCQLSQEDEIIVSDDGSSDKTVKIIEAYHDKRIKIINGPKKGVIKNFENAIKHCEGKYIFLSDQDDIWLPNKKERVMQIFETDKCLCVIHDCMAFSSKGEISIESFFKYRKSRNGVVKNIIKNSYIGCCMAFDSILKNKILPIPNNIEMHDQWIGILSEIYGNTIFLNEKLIMYRRHDGNVSNLKHYPLAKMILNRVTLIKELKKGGHI